MTEIALDDCQPDRTERRREYRRRWDKARRESDPVYAEKRRADSFRWKSKNRERVAEYAAFWRAKNPAGVRAQQQVRAWRLAAWKMIVVQEAGGRCVDCGNEHPILLAFDHIDPAAKSHDVRRKGSLESMRAEAKKCVLRCHNCHFMKTWIHREFGRRAA